MRIVQDLKQLRRKRKPVAVAAGFFDGIHIGHRKVIDTTLARAGELGGEAWVLTFDRHPLRLLCPQSAPPLLTSHRHKMILLQQMGIDGCVVMPFTRALADEPPDSFVTRLATGIPSLADVFVGSNWRFGQGGRGTPRRLTTLGDGFGFKVTVVRPTRRDGEIVSSTRVRSLVQKGQLDKAEQLLGRRFSVLGTVVHGRAIGRELGYPTANLDFHNEALPPNGVYAVQALMCGPDAELMQRLSRQHQKRMPLVGGVLNLGHRPTFVRGSRAKPVMEVHMFDGTADLYGQDVEVFFVRRLRPEQRFASRESLQRQITRDVSEAQAIMTAKEYLYTPSGGILYCTPTIEERKHRLKRGIANGYESD